MGVDSGLTYLTAGVYWVWRWIMLKSVLLFATICSLYCVQQPDPIRVQRVICYKTRFATNYLYIECCGLADNGGTIVIPYADKESSVGKTIKYQRNVISQTCHTMATNPFYDSEVGNDDQT